MQLLLVLALLIGDAAAGLASRLARGLALAATAVLCAIAKVASFDRLDMFHVTNPPYCYLIEYNIAHFPTKVKCFAKKTKNKRKIFSFEAPLGIPTSPLDKRKGMC